jgi:RNA polymerase sigma-70 factor, ECF subfamily
MMSPVLRGTFSAQRTRAVQTMSTPSESAAFTQLYDDLAAELLRYVWRRCRDRAQAEDLVSVVFLEAWRRRSTLRPGAP